MKTDIKGVEADEVLGVIPRKDLHVNGQELKAGVAVIVPKDFDMLHHCDVMEPEVAEEEVEHSEEKKRRKKSDK